MGSSANFLVGCFMTEPFRDHKCDSFGVKNSYIYSFSVSISSWSCSRWIQSGSEDQVEWDAVRIQALVHTEGLCRMSISCTGMFLGGGRKLENPEKSLWGHAQYWVQLCSVKRYFRINNLHFHTSFVGYGYNLLIIMLLCMIYVGPNEAPCHGANWLLF